MTHLYQSNLEPSTLSFDPPNLVYLIPKPTCFSTFHSVLHHLCKKARPSCGDHPSLPQLVDGVHLELESVQEMIEEFTE